MSLESRLAQELIRRHPRRAAAALERVPPPEAAGILSAAPPEQAAAVFRSMTPQDAALVLESLDPARAAQVLDALSLDDASRMARRVADERRSAIHARLSPRTARTLETLLRFPENTAGALMDPGILALPEDLTAREALRRVREASQYAQYNLYVVNREQALVGVLNLRELLRARPRMSLAEIMVRDPARLEAGADRSVILGHPAWRDVRALPVVDERGGYLGAVRYRVARQLEEEILGKRREEVGTAEALGDVFAAGAAGLLDALTGPVGDRRDRE